MWRIAPAEHRPAEVIAQPLVVEHEHGGEVVQLLLLTTMASGA
jgi:hypothetical protein